MAGPSRPHAPPDPGLLASFLCDSDFSGSSSESEELLSVTGAGERGADRPVAASAGGETGAAASSEGPRRRSEQHRPVPPTQTTSGPQRIRPPANYAQTEIALIRPLSGPLYRCRNDCTLDHGAWRHLFIHDSPVKPTTAPGTKPTHRSTATPTKPTHGLALRPADATDRSSARPAGPANATARPIDVEDFNAAWTLLGLRNARIHPPPTAPPSKPVQDSGPAGLDPERPSKNSDPPIAPIEPADKFISRYGYRSAGFDPDHTAGFGSVYSRSAHSPFAPQAHSDQYPAQPQSPTTGHQPLSADPVTPPLRPRALRYIEPKTPVRTTQPQHPTPSSDSPNMPDRKQPVRQTRTNPTRNAGARTLGGDEDAITRPEVPPGHFPGLTYFSEEIGALPKDMARQLTLLKEVEAKSDRPLEDVKKLVSAMLKKDVVPRKDVPEYQQPVAQVAGRAPLPMAHAPAVEQYDASRRETAYALRMALSNLNPLMDEKTHVLGSVNDALAKALGRLDSAMPQIEQEISEETRMGNPHHRALDTEAAPEKKPSAVGERPRREAALSHTAHAALAEERETVRAGGSRKNRIQQQFDSDFDDAPTRPTKAKAKNRKHGDAQAGLGIVNGAGGANKRRKVEKGGAAMERAVSQQGGASPSHTPGGEPTKRRARGNAMAGAVGGRKRAGTANSNTNSPAMASSPVLGAFAPTSTRGGHSPAMGSVMMQRSASARARTNSAAAAAARNTSMGLGMAREGSSLGSGNNGSGPAPVEPTSHPKHAGPGDLKVEDLSLADPVSATDDKHRPPAISTTSGGSIKAANGSNGGKASKTSTPVAASFAEAIRPRSGRAINPPAPFAEATIPQKRVGDAAAYPNKRTYNDGSASLRRSEGSSSAKRSHKKGAGLAAQQQKAAAEAALARAAEEGDELDEVEGEDGDEEEPTYCYCGGVSYGEMVACDGPACEREWFHLDCADLTKAPKGTEKWFCHDCQPQAKAAKTRA